MAEPAVLVTAPRLTEFIVEALTAMKMPRPPARTTAELMVRTDLRGEDSHGIGMLPRYHQWWEAGYISMDAEPTVVRDDMATGLMDGNKGLATTCRRSPPGARSRRRRHTASASWPCVTRTITAPPPTIR